MPEPTPDLIPTVQPVEHCGDTQIHSSHKAMRGGVVFRCPGTKPPTPERRAQYAAAIHRYDYEHGLSGNDIPSKHHRGAADAVLNVRDAELQQLREELEATEAEMDRRGRHITRLEGEVQRQVDAKVGITGQLGNALADKVTAEAALARVRALAERWDRATPGNQPLTELRAALDQPQEQP